LNQKIFATLMKQYNEIAIARHRPSDGDPVRSTTSGKTNLFALSRIGKRGIESVAGVLDANQRRGLYICKKSENHLA
jgi:hypothetical protein